MTHQPTPPPSTGLAPWCFLVERTARLEGRAYESERMFAKKPEAKDGEGFVKQAGGMTHQPTPPSATLEG